MFRLLPRRDRSPEFSLTDEAQVPPARQQYRSVLIVLAAIVGVALLFWYFSGASEKKDRGRPPATVGLAKATAQDMPVSLTAIGTVQPVVVATVRTQLAGTLFSIDFREGQQVAKGQRLAQIDPRPYRLALAQAEGALARDQAQLAVARTNLQRYRTLLSQDSIAKAEVDNQASLVGQLEGTIAADRAAVGTARLNLDYTSVTAPVSGRIGLRQADIGNYLTPSDANGIVVITQTTPIDVAFALPQDELPRLQQRLARGGALEVVALDQGATTVIGRGRFLTLDNQIDAATGTVRAKARFANGDGRLFPNQFVNVSILIDTLPRVVTVPVTAIRHGSSGDFVFVATADNKAALRPVKAGPTVDGRVAVLSGIKAGESVVTEGADRLEDGGEITLPGQKGSGGKRRQ
jgi:multidrug efflux system membrane fusion protein